VLSDTPFGIARARAVLFGFGALLSKSAYVDSHRGRLGLPRPPSREEMNR
jgi:hypothetical protein